MDYKEIIRMLSEIEFYLKNPPGSLNWIGSLVNNIFNTFLAFMSGYFLSNILHKASKKRELLFELRLALQKLVFKMHANVYPKLNNHQLSEISQGLLDCLVSYDSALVRSELYLSSYLKEELKNQMDEILNIYTSLKSGISSDSICLIEGYRDFWEEELRALTFKSKIGHIKDSLFIKEDYSNIYLNKY